MPFADDSSLFSIVHDTQVYSNDLNNDFEISKSWAFQWKMNFNSDPTQSSFSKHLGVILDTKSKFDEVLKMISSKLKNS